MDILRPDVNTEPNAKHWMSRKHNRNLNSQFMPYTQRADLYIFFRRNGGDVCGANELCVLVWFHHSSSPLNVIETNNNNEFSITQNCGARSTSFCNSVFFLCIRFALSHSRHIFVLLMLMCDAVENLQRPCILLRGLLNKQQIMCNHLAIYNSFVLIVAKIAFAHFIVRQLKHTNTSVFFLHWLRYGSSLS